MKHTEKVFDQLERFCRAFEYQFEPDAAYENTMACLYWSWDKSDCSEVGLAFTLVEYFLRNSHEDEKIYYIEELEYRLKKLKESK